MSPSPEPAAGSSLPVAGGEGPKLRLRLSHAAETAVRQGHPWVYAEKVRDQNRDGFTGELAIIYDRNDRFLAVGLYDAESPIRVRILHCGKPLVLDDGWWMARLGAAVECRRLMFDASTTGYRMIHGENDGFPGLVVDRYGTTLVAKMYTAAWFPRILSLLTQLQGIAGPERLVLRVSRNIKDRAAQAGFEDGSVYRFEAVASSVNSGANPSADSAALKRSQGNELPVALFLENGIHFEAEVIHGQKTGFFLDQRENRKLVEKLSAGRDVLNAFSFSGGFSLYAARGGARSVTDLDISGHALDSARRNWELNRPSAFVDHCRVRQVQADAFEWLAAESSGSFDLVILDPPSMARRESERERAIQAYGKLVGLGLRRLRTGGILVAASCSAHVSAGEFFMRVREEARKSGRPHSEIQTTRHPADHPATFAEAEYLKCITLTF